MLRCLHHLPQPVFKPWEREDIAALIRRHVRDQKYACLESIFDHQLEKESIVRPPISQKVIGEREKLFKRIDIDV